MPSWDTVLETAGLYFNEHPDEFNDSIEWADEETNYLDDALRRPMYDIDERCDNLRVKAIMKLALNGYDADTGDDFNPNREYYYTDYWTGRLISTDIRDYSELLDTNAIDAIFETYKFYIDRNWTIRTWMIPAFIKSLFDEYIDEEIEDD